MLADPICKVDNVFHSHAQVAAVAQLISLLTENQTMMNQNLVRSRILLGLMVAFCSQALAQDPKAASVAQVRALSEKRTEAFNAGKADAVAAFFHEDCEYVDEFGTHYQGKNEVTKLLGDYFSRFPGLAIVNESESIRAVGSIVIEEGTRKTTAADGALSQVRYIAVYEKSTDGWQIASLRDVDDSPLPTPGQMLQGLEWLIGEWINEGTDGQVHIAYRWSEDKNFILGDIDVRQEGVVTSKSHQRIGWDPALGKPRSWLFDSDGGFGGGHWTQLDGRWVVHSSAVLPDGTNGSAMITLTPLSTDRFSIHGSNRLVGESAEQDFEIIVARKPPAPSK